MTDDLLADKTYAGAVIARLRQEPTPTEEQRALLAAATDQEEGLAWIVATLRREGKL